MALSDLKRENIEGVIVTACLDEIRPLTKEAGKDGELLYPVVIRVTYQRKRVYRRTGMALAVKDYEEAVRAEKPTSRGGKIRRNILPFFERYCDVVKDMKARGVFSLSDIPTLSGFGDKEEKPDEKPLYRYWMDIAESRDKAKTGVFYADACRSFFIANGATRTMAGRTARLSGRILLLKPSEFRPGHVERWREFMTDNGNSSSSQAARLRALRAVLYSLEKAEVIEKAPKIEMPPATRRRDIFLTVPDILKLRDYDGEGKKYADWWVMLYLLNGANLRDVAALEWPDVDCSEFSFTRAKTAGKSPYRVQIPITELLVPYLAKYASERVAGERVFPQILLGAKSDKQISSRVHDFNADIRKGLMPICKALKIKTVSAEWARNSYITTLTWHGISDAFIDDMVGHADGKVLSGYQGLISPKKRLKINSLLFTDPEEEEE